MSSWWAHKRAHKRAYRRAHKRATNQSNKRTIKRASKRAKWTQTSFVHEQARVRLEPSSNTIFLILSELEHGLFWPSRARACQNSARLGSITPLVMIHLCSKLTCTQIFESNSLISTQIIICNSNHRKKVWNNILFKKKSSDKRIESIRIERIK